MGSLQRIGHQREERSKSPRFPKISEAWGTRRCLVPGCIGSHAENRAFMIRLEILKMRNSLVSHCERLGKRILDNAFCPRSSSEVHEPFCQQIPL